MRPIVVTLGLITALLSPALAQRATVEQMGRVAGTENYSTLHMQSNLGSFKIYPGEGRATVNFTGTVLISGLEGDIEVSPGLVTEFSKYNRTVYHGTGTITVTGKWRAFQWFGTDMTAVWYGKGQCRIIGEFDRDLKTGRYWYDDPEDGGTWATSLLELKLPEQKVGFAPGVVPERRGGGGN